MRSYAHEMYLQKWLQFKIRFKGVSFISISQQNRIYQFKNL